ncbi:uncharacterized protein LOC117651422 [Thrips palmi]|uniref:Uncharacterized protein LOC117651422 n=1 Tax=Thrips palmi TaxID=161013 RepID=A0A6P9A0S8_THRPL|nr:uncharacterized protein LOC117651422 [Thrips palmi]
MLLIVTPLESHFTTIYNNDYLTALSCHGLLMIPMLVIILLCQWTTLEFDALVKELVSLHIDQQQAFDRTAERESRSLLSCIDHCQDNRFSLAGICHCNIESGSQALLAVGKYFVIDKLQEFH